jgi:hypothetical protein
MCALGVVECATSFQRQSPSDISGDRGAVSTCRRSRDIARADAAALACIACAATVSERDAQQRDTAVV